MKPTIAYKVAEALPPTPQFASVAEATAAGQTLAQHINLLGLIARDDAPTLRLATSMGARLNQYHTVPLSYGHTERTSLLTRAIVLGARNCFNFLVKHADLEQSCDFAVPQEVDSPSGPKQLMNNCTALDAASWREIETGDGYYYQQLLLAGARASREIPHARILQDARNARRRAAYAAAKAPQAVA